MRLCVGECGEDLLAKAVLCESPPEDSWRGVLADGSIVYNQW